MKKQLIISVGREYGSGGHLVADKLAEKYGLPLYDRNLLKEVAASRNLDSKDMEEFDEIQRNKLMSRTVRGFNNSPAHNVAMLQFEYLKRMADEGKSFVVVGRCAETVLRDCDALISIFVLGDFDDKIARLMEHHGITEHAAKIMRTKEERKRKTYHNSNCEGKWGDSRNYDISINASKLGIDETARVLANYIDARIAEK